MINLVEKSLTLDGIDQQVGDAGSLVRTLMILLIFFVASYGNIDIAELKQKQHPAIANDDHRSADINFCSQPLPYIRISND
jgi:hypothetical protein